MLAVIGLQAQEDYNKWSVEIGAGANKATEGFAQDILLKLLIFSMQK